MGRSTPIGDRRVGSSFSFAPGSILEPLAPYQDKLIVLDGIDFFDVANHEAGMANMLTGGGGANTLTGGKSLDQYLAAQVGSGDKFPPSRWGSRVTVDGGKPTNPNELYGARFLQGTD